MTLLRIIESTLPIGCSWVLDRHAATARLGGWTVHTIQWPRNNPRDPQRFAALKAEIAKYRHFADLHVMLIGDLPLPFSGFQNNPDGHPETTGAYQCPAYYVTDNEGWTDERNNTGYPSRPVHKHVAGDGILDQDKLPSSAWAAVGVVNLTPASRNASWRLGAVDSERVIRAYERYFDHLHKWNTGEYQVKAHCGVTAFNQSYNTNWLNATNPDQPKFNRYNAQFEECTPFGLIADFKVVPPNGTAWYNRTKPLAFFYLQLESYQTLWNTTRNQHPLMSGCAVCAPVYWMWDMSGWLNKTVGQLWQQSAKQGAQVWISLFGDPTVRLPKPTS